MRGLMISGPSSNSGKTILSLGIIRALANRGIAVSPFKTGPDFIDSRYLGQAARGTAGNLDMHMMGKKGLRHSLSMSRGELAIVEGAMGYFDGIYNSYENSSYDIARKLGMPTVLVYSPKGEMFSAIPKIQGMLDFKDSNIKGLILNKVNPSSYRLLKEQIERHIDIKLLGYLPFNEGLALETEELGLDPSKGDDFLNYLAEKIDETIDLDSLLSLGQEIQVEGYKYPSKRKIKIAVAQDEAFAFHYRENLKLMEESCQLEFFSPLRDKKAPNADLIYLGGGYLDKYRVELSSNKEFMKDLKAKGEGGQYILAESTGLIYLLDFFEESKMTGLIKGRGKKIDSLKRFGYVNIELAKDCILGKKGSILKGQEYHKTSLDTDLEEVFKISKPMSKRSWTCAYHYKNVLAYMQNINFLGNIEAFNYLLDQLEGGRI